MDRKRSFNRRMMRQATIGLAAMAICVGMLIAGDERPSAYQPVSTFSIVARDPSTGEMGVAVASRFFAVGTVVPWAKANVGAVATQSYANTSFGWRGLELLEKRMTPQAVVDTMEKTFLKTDGTLASRLYAALMAGDAAGGDSRGRQSAAMLVVKAGAGYGGYTDRAIDIRVDDAVDPFKELGRLLDLAQVNYSWNEAWTLFTEKKFAEALPIMERAGRLAPSNAEVMYDLTVIRLAAGEKAGALEALEKALGLNPLLKKQAAADNDLMALRGDPKYEALVK